MTKTCISVCFLMLSSFSWANPPRGFRIFPGVPGELGAGVAPGPERDNLIEAIEKINELSHDEATVVFFARATQSQAQAPLCRRLIEEWSGLLAVPVSANSSDILNIETRHDLETSEASLVFLVRRTPAGQIDSVRTLVTKYFNELTQQATNESAGQ